MPPGGVGLGAQEEEAGNTTRGQRVIKRQGHRDD